MKTHAEKGFTLIEMLVIAPIAIIIIAGFIALMVNMTGDVIASQQRSIQVYDTQDALNRIEQDVNHANLFSSNIPSSSLTSPQGSSNDSAAWPASPAGSTLLLQKYATTQNPLSTSSTINLIYNSLPNDCATYPDYTYNRPYAIYVIYFLVKPTGSSTGTLWRRTILPPVSPATCGTPWQRNSCATGAPLNGSPCKAHDEDILDNVSSATFDYYLNPGDSSSSSNLEGSNTINATLTTDESIAGHPYTYISHLRVTRFNNAQ